MGTSTKHLYNVPATENVKVWAEPTHRSFIGENGSDIGWDWGPTYATPGLTGPAHVKLFSCALEIADVHVVQQFADGGGDMFASVNVSE